MWWAEYVIRQGGAHHLKPASLQLAWYQLYLLDVVAVLAAILFLTVLVTVKICSCCYRKTFAKLKTD